MEVVCINNKEVLSIAVVRTQRSFTDVMWLITELWFTIGVIFPELQKIYKGKSCIYHLIYMVQNLLRWIDLVVILWCWKDIVYRGW